MSTISLILLGVMPALAILAGLNDLTSMRIPNWISGLLVIGFFPAAFAVGLTPMTVAIHVAVGLAALFVGMAMFAMRWLGGGDAKLMAGVSLWLGLAGVGPFVLWTAVIGGLFCLVLMLARNVAAPYLPSTGGWVYQLMQPKADIPYGVAIAAGALMAFPGSALFLAWQAG